MLVTVVKWHNSRVLHCSVCGVLQGMLGGCEQWDYWMDSGQCDAATMDADTAPSLLAGEISDWEIKGVWEKARWL